MSSTSVFSRSLAVALLVVLSSAGIARAQVSCSLTSDTSAPLIGGTFTTTTALARNTAGTGFAPALEVFVPPGLTLTQASVLGQTLSRQTVGTFVTTLVNPITQEVVSGPTGFTLVLVRLPFGGLPQGAGAQNITLNWSVNASAVAGMVLRPQVTCLFAFGNDALNNPATDAPIRSDVRTNAGDQLGVDVTLSLARLSKTASPSPTVTGPGFPVTYVLSLDVAAGTTITGGSIQDTLPPQFQVSSITASSGGTVVSPAPIPTTPGGSLSVSFPSITGTAATNDATVTVRGYVPRLDASNADVLSPTCVGGSTASIGNTASFINGVVGATPVTVAPASATLAVRAEQVRETITNLTSGGTNFRPGETGRITLVVSASDFFALSGVTLNSVLGAGMHFSGNATVDGSPAMPTLSGDFRNVGFALGVVAAGATHTISYEFLVDEAYSASPGDSVRAGDVITTQHTLTSTTAAGCTLTSTEVQGGADGSINIGSATLSKTLLAINGVPAPVGTAVRPGDVVTWRVTLVQRAGDLSGATLVDYLPRPLFNAQEYGATPAFPSATLRFGAGNTLPVGTTVSLTATAASADNSLTINVGAFDVDPTTEVRMVFDLDFTTSSEPREDGLGFTNLVRATMLGSGTTSVTATGSTAFGAGDPAVTVHTGTAQVSSTVGGPAKTTGITNSTTLFVPATYTSTTLAALPATNTLTGPDGADVITWRVIAENKGSTSAHDVRLSDVPPAALTCDATPVSVTNGVGTALAFTSITVAGGVGWQLTAPLPGYHATNGLNVAVVTLRCTVAGTGWTPGTTVTNTANVVNFASVPGGANFAPANYVPNQDTSSLVFSNFAVTKTRTDTLEPVTRDTVGYSLTVTVPEGSFTNISLVDAFPARLALAAAAGPTLVLPAGVSATGSLTPTVNATGTTVTWALGNVSNTNSTDARETSTAMALTAVVLNSTSTVTGNVFRVTQGATTLATVTAPNLTLRTPALTFTQTVAPNPAAGGATPTVTATIASSSATTNRTAHDVRYTLTAPSGCTNPTGVTVTGVTGTSSVASNVVTVDFTSIAPGQTATITFTCSVPALAVIGSTVTLPGTVTWTSQPGTPAQLGPNTLAVEGSFSASANTSLNIAPLVMAKTRIGTGVVVVGQAVDFDVSMTVPVGTTNLPLTITDSMVDGLVFGSVSNFTADAALTCGGASCTLPVPVITNSGRTLAWNLGTVTNTGSSQQVFAFRVRTFVTNVAAAVRSAVLTNTFSAGTPLASSAVTVAEPALSFVATASPTSGNAGDVATLTIALTNSTVTNLNVSAAQDAVVALALPTDVEVVAGSYASANCPTPAAQSLSGATPFVTFTSIAATTSCTFTVNVRLRDTVVLGTSLSLGVLATWSSLPGDVTTAQSTLSAVSTERTGDITNPGGALNTYRQQSAVLLAAAQTASIVKTLVSSASSLTADPAIALGEEATWRLRVQVGEGVTPSVTVIDTPPAALQLTSVTLDRTGFTGVIASDPTGTLSLAAGAAATFTLGNISNPGDNDASNDFFTLVVTGRPTLHASVVSPAQNNVAVLRSGSTGIGTSSLAISYALPKLRITQTVATTTPAPGAELTGSTSLANQGNGPACAPSVVVTAPTGFTFVDPATDGLDNNQNGTVDEAAEAGFLVGSVLTVPVTGCIPGGGTTALPWKLRTAASIASGGVTLSSALQPFRSLPAPDGVALTATTDLFDNNNNAQTDETNDGRVTTTLNPAAPVLVVTKTFVDVNGGALVPGDVLEWRVVVRNTGTGPSTGLTLTDTLPSMHAAIVAASASTTQGTVTLTGNLLNVDVGNLAAGATVTATVRQRIDSTLTAAVQLSNQANLTTSDAYGPRVSDDPGTAAVDDATVAIVSSGTPTPVITTPANNSTTNDTTPAVTGTSGPGATVTVFFDGSTTPACTATADVAGNWSCTPTTALSMGSHTVTAQASTGSGTSFVSQPNTFTVDTNAPTVAIVTPVSGAISATPTVTVTGTTEANATVDVFLDGATTPFCTVTADASGNWSCPTSSTLTDGSHAVTAVATDAAGNDSAPTTHSFVIDTTDPVVPVITAPGEGDTTSPTPTFAGTAEAGSTVTIFVDGSTTAACTATADALGNFTCVATTALTVGPHTVIATSTDAAGNSSDSSVRNFTVEPAIAPDPPTLATPVDGSRTTDTTPTFTGTAAVGSNVAVYVDGSMTAVCTAVADVNGAFTCTPTTPLAEGPHSAVATATNAYGTSAPSTANDFSIDSIAPTAPVITSPAPNATTNLHPTYTGTAEAGSNVEVFLDGSSTPVCTTTADVNGQWACTGSAALTPGAHEVTARATDDAGNQSPNATPHPFTAAAALPSAVITSPAANEVVGSSTPDFVGTATPNATISVYVDGSSTPSCVTVADNNGDFSCRGMSLVDGAHTVTVTASDREGTSQPGTPVPFVVDTIAPAAPVVLSPADGSTTNALPTYSGTAEPGSTVTVRVDGFVVCEITASASGEWSCTSSTALALGAHTVNATSTDAGGNRSPTSATNTFTVEGPPPPPEREPSLTSPTEGERVGLRPTFTGSGEPGGTIEVLVDGSVVCTATIDTAGAWSCTATSDLTAGAHSAIARQTTPRSTTQTGEVHFTVAAKPVVTSPGEGELLRTDEVTFTGTATPLSAVEVIVDGELVCTAMSDAAGAFSCAASMPLPQGEHTVVARSSGRESDPVTFTIGELDRNGDGIVDGTYLTGGGCAAAPTGLWLLAGAAWLLRRRRARAS